MARYTGPACKLCRREGMKLFLKGDRCMGPKCAIERNNTRPGQHGQARARKASEFGSQLREKQKMRRSYGVLEAQFSRQFDIAAHRPGKTSDNFIQILESRFDNVIYRLGFADSRAQARQLVNHGHFKINNRKVDIPSYSVKKGDVITVRDSSKTNEYFKTRSLLLAQKAVPTWLRLNIEAMSGVVEALPARQDVEVNFNEALVVEFYQR